MARSSYTKDLKIVLDTSFFNTQQYKVRIKGIREKSASSPTLRVTLDYGRQLYLLTGEMVDLIR